MKKNVTLLLVAALLVSALSGCGGSSFKPERGTWNENTYTNNALGLVFEKPESWAVATEQEMAELMGVGLEVVQESTGTQYSEKMFELQNIFDLYAYDAATGDSALILFENLALSGAGDVKMEDYVTAFTGQMQQVGLFDAFETDEVQIAGETYTKVSVSTTSMGFAVSQTTLLRKLDSYMLVITLTGMGESNPDDMVAYFSAK